MTDDTDTTTEESTDGQAAAGRTTTASSTYKVLGEFAAPSGAGVLGKNTAGSGTPIGVEGAAPNATGGYGLSTPDDARVAGTAELTALSGSLTGSTEVTDLLGPALSVDGGALTATEARVDVSDGTTTVPNVETITFDGPTITDDGDGTVTIDE